MVKLKRAGEGGAESESSLDMIGEKLRLARQNKGLSLEDVQKATKMHPKTIEALERGRLEDKVGEAYVRAFLKNYATYLGMDGKSIVAEYVSKKHGSEKQITEARKAVPTRKEIAPKKKISPKRDYSELVRAVTTVIVFIAVLIALVFVATKLGQYAKSISAEIKARSIAKKAETARLPKENKPAAHEIVPIPRQDKLTLTITTSNDVWLKVMLDGKVVFYNTLSKKSKETWKAEKEIRLSEIGKPESLKLNVNGKDIDFSKNRLARSVLITQEGVDFEPK